MCEVIMDINKINESMSYTKDNVSLINSMVTQVVSEYSEDLDKVMKNIMSEIIGVELPAIVTVEKYFVELSGVLYFMCSEVEKLGVYDSLSKLKAQETYNNSYLNSSIPTQTGPGTKKKTVAEITAIAENDSSYDRTVNDIYNRAYKILKSKVSAAETMISTLSKIMNHRMQESQLTTTQMSRVLNEDTSPFNKRL